MKGFSVNLPYKAKLVIKPKHLTLSSAVAILGQDVVLLISRHAAPGPGTTSTDKHLSELCEVEELLDEVSYASAVERR